MKLWIDDVRPAPEGYKSVKSVNEAIFLIKTSEKSVQRHMECANQAFRNRDYQVRNINYNIANMVDIQLIDIDHDAGDYANDGGDYIKLLDWLEETGRNYPIRIHSMNPVGVANMRRIIQRNGWTEVT
jgi:hypothetical protein